MKLANCTLLMALHPPALAPPDRLRRHAGRQVAFCLEPHLHRQPFHVLNTSATPAAPLAAALPTPLTGRGSRHPLHGRVAQAAPPFPFAFNPTRLDGLSNETAFVLHVHFWSARRAWPARRTPLHTAPHFNRMRNPSPWRAPFRCPLLVTLGPSAYPASHPHPHQRPPFPA